MSKAAETARQWLNDLVKSANLSEEEKKALESTLAKPEALDYVGRSALRQADYDRLMNQQKADYQRKMQEVQSYEKDLADWRGKTEAQVAQAQAEYNQAIAEAQRIRQVAYSYSLTDEDLGAPVNPRTAPVGTPSPQDPPVNKPTAEFSIDSVLQNQQFQELTTMHTLLPAEINDITAEHVELFGTQPKGMRQIVERAMQERRPVREIWAETFEVADKKAELDKQRVESEIQRRVEEERVKMRSEFLSGAPLPRPGIGQGSYVLSQRDKLTPSDDTPSTRVDGVNAAVQFWNTLKHDTE